MVLLIYIPGNRPTVLSKEQEGSHFINTRELYDDLSKEEKWLLLTLDTCGMNLSPPDLG